MKDKTEIQKFIDSNLSDFKKYLEPRNYILGVHQTVDRKIVFRYLQNMVRVALAYFINGCYWFAFTRRDLLSPSYSKVEDRIKRIFLEIAPILEIAYLRFNYFSEFYSKLKKVNKKFFVSEEEIAELFNIFYREFENILPALKFENEITKAICPELKIEDYPIHDFRYLKPLAELKSYAQNYLQEYLAGFYLHGSLSTMDYIPYWSDVDTLMVLKKETIRNSKNLIKLRKHAIISQKYFYQIDPHQLHGHLLFSEFDMDYYSQTYFPPVIFEYSKSFFNIDNPMLFKLRECETERIATFWNDAVYYFLQKGLLTQRYRICSMIYRARKLFIHRLLTFPLFYLQAKGQYTYKKYSFGKAKAEFPENLWAIIETATTLMKQWKYEYKANRYLKSISAINPKLYMLLINKHYDFKYPFIKGVFQDFDEDYEKWLSQAIDLSIVAWNKIVRAER